jgi:DNA topoisomerase-1
MHEVSIEDRSVARIVRRCQELPGQRLFQFVDGEGEVRHVRSEHVNDYLRAVTGEDFTAKDFRTWHASVCAMGLALQACEAAGDGAGAGAPAGPDAVAIVRQVAQRLGNTCAVCRKFYIHPDVMRLCENSGMGPTPLPRRRKTGLSREECALLAQLSQAP